MGWTGEEIRALNEKRKAKLEAQAKEHQALTAPMDRHAKKYIHDPQTLATITDLALMSEALSCLQSITTEQGTTGSLKLAKGRRQA